MEPKVDFIIAGAQKAGTTALFDYLGDHPQIGLSDVKEVHFFDDEARDWATPNYLDYHARFDLSDRTKVWGEATPIYLYWKDSLERICTYRPDIKLIVLLRDPVARAFSHWKMEYARGVETAPFDWCVRRGRTRLFDSAPWGWHREFSYVERGFYGEQVERLFGLFPREQVLILQAEALDAEPSATLSKVCDFLGVAPFPQIRPRRVHEARDLPYPSRLTPEDAAHLRAIYARDSARLHALTGLSFG
ncbi:MAG: sulfotransferase [Phenylobacterium sp. RIFCSPHIGHO2_01_FULL_70_10]|nr:MAG: sulfotransferase [Phenylobacterium sp. RIFCSPHIGHO2_01_FULL_70_10]